METLFDYQVEGALWLANRRQALLADDMGVGKSAQAIRAADFLHLSRVLVVCPAVVRVNWHREFQKFSWYRRNFSVVLDGKTRPSALQSAIISYDLAVTYHRKGWLKGPWGALILDEGHFVKSIGAQRTAVIMGTKGLIREAERIWVLTGTPMPNNPSELWPLLYTFGQTKLTYQKFIEKFCHFVTGFPDQITGTKLDEIPELRKLITPIWLRRRKEDVLKTLPPITFNDVIVQPGKITKEDLATDVGFIQYLLPDDRREELMARIQKEERTFVNTIETVGFHAASDNSFKIMEAMASSVSTLRRYVGLQKVEPVAQMVTHELKSNAYDKVVIFAVHHCVIEGLRERLKEFGAVTLYGKTPENKRQRNIDRFQHRMNYRVFIANIRAAGTGVTLTAAHHVIFAEQEWVPGNNLQAVMRCHRLGQEKHVSCRFVGLADSIDEKVANVLKRKTKEILAVMDGNSYVNPYKTVDGQYVPVSRKKVIDGF